MNSTIETIKKLNGTTITVGEKTSKFNFKTVLDGRAVNTGMGRTDVKKKIFLKKTMPTRILILKTFPKSVSLLNMNTDVTLKTT